LREALDEWGRETLLVYFLGGHWRKPIDFSYEALEQAAAQAESFRNSFRDEPGSSPESEWARFAAALDDDFNTPDALAVLHDWRGRRAHELLFRGLEVFGLDSLAEGVGAPFEVRELAERRLDARRRQDFGEADRLRREIEALGWEARDQAGGVVLVPKR
jgi:cysteinyl-tRNA synthetase